MAQLRLANLLEDAKPLSIFMSVELNHSSKLKYHQPAMDGQVFELEGDKDNLYLRLHEKPRLYKIPAAKVPVT